MNSSPSWVPGKRASSCRAHLLRVILVASFCALGLAASSSPVQAKRSKDDNQALLDAAEQLRLREFPSARKTLESLCPGDLQDAVRGAKKGKIPCRLIIIAETETRGTRTADKLSLLYWNVADDARKDEQYALAKALYTVAIDRNSSDPVNWYWLGIVERDLGQFAASRQALARVLELNPDDRDALYWTATDFMDERQYDEAIALLDRLIENGPKDGRAWYRRGEVLVHMGRCAEATSDLEKARSLGINRKKIRQQLKECTSAGN